MMMDDRLTLSPEEYMHPMMIPAAAQAIPTDMDVCAVFSNDFIICAGFSLVFLRTKVSRNRVTTVSYTHLIIPLALKTDT